MTRIIIGQIPDPASDGLLYHIEERDTVSGGTIHNDYGLTRQGLLRWLEQHPHALTDGAAVTWNVPPYELEEIKTGYRQLREEYAHVC